VRVLIVTGIWPPDVGGPASHAPEVAAFLHARGHAVEVVTTAQAPPAAAAYPVRWISRRVPVGVRHVRGALVVRARAAANDVVYTTGMFGRSAAGATLARRPFVVKLTADPAYERARRRGLFSGSLADFQRGGGGSRVAALRTARNAELRLAAHIVCPSEYLRGLAVGWGLEPERVSVLPNPAPALPSLVGRDELRERLGLNGTTLVFAGRLTRQKSLETALEALAHVEGVSLLVVGEGDEREELERRASELRLGARVRFVGPKPREEVLGLLRAADALLLPSAWENFPHTVIESLAVGTPVLATRTGGVAEVIVEGENGLLVEPGDASALAEAVQRFVADDGLRERLRARAAASVERYAAERVYARLESVLEAATL
jgi:glycosyltransferase involved in cell wall biosynthesis